MNIQTHSALRQMPLQYAGICDICGRPLAKGVHALYDLTAKTVRCLECSNELDAPDTLRSDPFGSDAGMAGASAQREYERRKTARENAIKGRHGRLLGGLIVALTEEPASIRAWARGASGERQLAAALAGIAGIHVLHDRRVPGTAGNIDHLVVAPAGVFVVDAKFYQGLVRIRDVGGFRKTNKRLYVGRWDCSQLAENMDWQVEAIRQALSAAHVDPLPPITPVLCFIHGDWPFFRPPDVYAGVRLEGERSLRALVAASGALDGATIDRLAHILARSLAVK